MRIFLILVSLGLFITGLIYFYSPATIIVINNWMKKVFFDDSRVKQNRKKTGMLYIIVALIVFFAAFCFKLIPDRHSVKTQLYQSWCCYYQGEYDTSKKISEQVLKVEPENQAALEQLMLIYFVENDYPKAKYYCEKVLAKNPNNKRTKNMYDTIQNKIKGARAAIL